VFLIGLQTADPFVVITLIFGIGFPAKLATASQTVEITHKAIFLVGNSKRNSMYYILKTENCG